jgi:hypothetical protein
MIRVTLADGSVEILDRQTEPRRPDETLYDFMLRSAHETGLEARALRSLLDAHVASVVAERTAVARRRRLMLIGQSVIAGTVASLLIRPDTIGDACIIALPDGILTMVASLVLSHFMPRLDHGLVRVAQWWRR